MDVLPEVEAGKIGTRFPGGICSRLRGSLFGGPPPLLRKEFFLGSVEITFFSSVIFLLRPPPFFGEWDLLDQNPPSEWCKLSPVVSSFRAAPPE